MEKQKISSRNYVYKYNLEEWDLNLHLIRGDRYNYLIDTGMGRCYLEPLWEELNGSDKQLIVVNTHYHWDHIWGNHYFRDEIIVSHKLCPQLIVEHWDNDLEKNLCYADGEIVMYLPNLTFEKELYFSEDKIRIIYTPGHTPDSISVIDEVDKVINVGDNIGDDMEYILPSLATDIEIYRNTIRAYQKLDVDYCISGHNKVVGKEIFAMLISETEKDSDLKRTE